MEVAMPINVQSAIAYNVACNYPSKLIQVILTGVRAPGAWMATGWNEAGVTAVAEWQKFNNLTSDGMVGPNSLDRLIYEHQHCGKTAEADVLRDFLAKAKAAQKAAQAAKKKEIGKIVSSFTRVTTHPFRFEKEQALDPKTGRRVPAWAARGTFEVAVKLNPALSKQERLRYEYRQYIKGSGWVQDGQWNAQRTHWAPIGNPINISSRFEVPPDPPRDPNNGLTQAWKEDGKFPEVPGGAPFRFGYRDGAVKNGTRFRSKWSPHNVSGPNYTLRDSPGYSEIYDGSAPRVRMDFTFRGVVVEVEEVEAEAGDYTKVVREIEEQTWTYHFDQALKWWLTPPAAM
jgi:hypothetical protein